MFVLSRRTVQRLYAVWLAAGLWMIGGAPFWATGALAAGWALWLVYLRGSVPRIALRHPFFWCLLLACVWSLVQLVPVGIDHAGPFDTVVSLGTLSIDPGETSLAAVRALTALCAWLATCACVFRWGRVRVLECVADAATLTALVAAAHAAVGLERIFGLYAPAYDIHQAFAAAPLVNPNHLASVLGGCLPVTIALSIPGGGGRSPLWRILGAVAIAIMLGLTGSNAGYVGTLAGLVVMAWVGRRVWIAEMGPRLASLVVPATVVSALLVAGAWRLFIGRDRPPFEALRTKLSVYRELPAVMADHEWLGVGRGAFGVAHFVSFGGAARRFYAESWPGQLLVDLGVPVSLALAGLALWGLRRSWSGLPGLAGAAAVGGAVAFAVHDLADFSLELVGVRIVFVTLLAVVGLSSRDANERMSPASSNFGVVFAAVAVGGGAFVFSKGSEMSVLELQARLRHLSPIAAAGAAREVQSWHPREPVLAAFIAAGEIASGRPRESLERLSTLLRWAPHWGEAHRLVAVWLDRQGYRNQAAIEVREAERLQPKSADHIACSWMRSGDATAVVRAAPSGIVGSQFLARATRCVANGRATVDAALIERDPTASAPRERVARRLGGLREWRGVLEQVQAVPVERRTSELNELEFKARMGLGQVGDAQKVLQRASESLSNTARWRARFHLAVGQDEVVVAQKMLARLRSETHDRSPEGQSLLKWAARLWSHHGYPDQALEVFATAYKARPSADLLDRMVLSARAAGRDMRAQVLQRRKCLQFRVGCEQVHKP